MYCRTYTEDTERHDTCVRDLRVRQVLTAEEGQAEGLTAVDM